MRLGSIIYFIPFFFVLEPALILDGAWPDILLSTASAFLGIVLAAGALQGYLLLVGDLTRHAVLQWPLRVLILLAGLLLAMPGGGLVPWSDLQMAGTAALFMGCALTLVALARRRSPAAQADGPAP